MKHVIYFLSGTMIFILTIMLLLTMSRKNASDVELADSVHHVLETTVQNVLDEKKADYSIEHKEEFIADFTESLLVTIDTASDIEVTIYEYDPVAGILSVKVKESYKEPDGSIGTAECISTVVVDYEAKDPLPDQIVINLKYIDKNGVYKLYKSMTMRDGSVLGNIDKPTDSLADGKWVYESTGTDVIWNNGDQQGLAISASMENIEDADNKKTLNMLYQVPSGLYASDGSYTSWQQLKDGGYLTVDAVKELYGGASVKNIKGILVIDPEVKAIKDSPEDPYGAFSNCVKLTGVIFPHTITYIGGNAFWGCTGLRNITLPDSITNLWGDAFVYCRNLENVTFSNNLKDIGGFAFEECNLKEAILPDTVENIQQCAFCRCTSLTKVKLSNNIKNIQRNAFESCTSLSSIEYKGTTYTSLSKLKKALSNNNVDFDNSSFSNTGLNA